MPSPTATASKVAFKLLNFFLIMKKLAFRGGNEKSLAFEPADKRGVKPLTLEAPL